MNRPRSRPGVPARGFSVIELMVALALSLLLVAAMFVSCLGTLSVSRQQRALSDMTQRAQMAFSFIRRDIQAAGYVHPVEISSSRYGAVNASVTDRPIFGCSDAFLVPQAPLGLSDCGPPGAGSDAIEINFEAARYSALQDSNDLLADCRGSALVAAGAVSQASAPVGSTRIATASRYFVEEADGTPMLYCASPSSTKGALVPHVQQLQVRYGLSSGWTHEDPSARRPSRFVAASQITGSQWADVVAVRLCLLVQSPEPVLVGGESATASYLGCDGLTHLSTDGLMRRAFVSTVAVRNRGAM